MNYFFDAFQVIGFAGKSLLHLQVAIHFVAGLALLSWNLNLFIGLADISLGVMFIALGMLRILLLVITGGLEHILLICSTFWSLEFLDILFNTRPFTRRHLFLGVSSQAHGGWRQRGPLRWSVIIWERVLVRIFIVLALDPYWVLDLSLQWLRWSCFCWRYLLRLRLLLLWQHLLIVYFDDIIVIIYV